LPAVADASRLSLLTEIVIVFRFTHADHLTLRFAISPLFELVCSRPCWARR
jgi:hypothetical protein